MLSRLLIVGQGPEIGTQTVSYLLNLVVAAGASAQPARNCERSVIRLESGISAGRTSCPDTLCQD